MLTVGDGSFLYNPIVQSLSASRDLDLPVLVVVVNNRRYLSMQINHQRFYPGGVAVQDDNFRGVDLAQQPDLAALAAPFGMLGATVRASRPTSTKSSSRHWRASGPAPRPSSTCTSSAEPAGTRP